MSHMNSINQQDKGWEMSNLIMNLNKLLNMVKNFSSGYHTAPAWHGYMLLTHLGKRYAVKIVEMSEADQNNDGFDAVENVPYYFKD